MQVLESSLERRVVKAANKLGVRFAIKLELRSDAGWPDRLLIIPGGRPLFLEFKREGEKPRALQAYRLSQLKALGYDAEWADNYDDAIRYITRAMDSSRRAEKGRKIPS